MKNLLRNAVLLVSLGWLSTNADAQSNTSIERQSAGIIYGAGLESGLMTGSSKDNHQWLLGGFLQADLPITKRIYFNLNAGYDNYFGKDNANGPGFSPPDMHVLPVVAGFKTFLLPVLYLEGDQGAAFLLNKDDLGYSRSAAFVFTQQIGLKLPLQYHQYLDAGIRYEGTAKFESGDRYSKLNSLSIRIAYAFGSK